MTNVMDNKDYNDATARLGRCELTVTIPSYGYSCLFPVDAVVSLPEGFLGPRAMGGIRFTRQDGRLVLEVTSVQWSR